MLCPLLDAQRDSDVLQSLQLGFTIFLLPNVRNPRKSDDSFHSTELWYTSEIFLSWDCSYSSQASIQLLLSPRQDKTLLVFFFIGYLQMNGCFLALPVLWELRIDLFWEKNHTVSWFFSSRKQGHQICIMSKILHTLNCNSGINGIQQ